MSVKHAVTIYEYESGRGSRIDEVRYFSTEAEAKAFVIKFNSVNDQPSVPDWCMMAEYCGTKEVK